MDEMIELAVPEDELMARLINRGKESGRKKYNHFVAGSATESRD